ncbi:GNAT family N-acetyltransferase [Rossellomorea aquimaris]|uniref:GNAT family N-acetyltransferase n=1 Tax=Rossellomorea aquimaris TaxID=189382 RepID=UPI001CD7E3D9|nr:GNAT family N-acetyltransferase [Rossellomorea aquimaris]MCA1054246.1 GNAT family N-acetyltransferase [Rossellomorea aquimaris]
MNVEIVEHLNNEQVEELHEMFQKEWWTKGRTMTDIQSMLENSDVVIAFVDAKGKELIAFARVLTDYVYKAIIFDVMVHASYRGEHVGEKLMRELIHHPSLEKVNHFELYCRTEMVPYYEKWGFTNNVGELQFMRRG